MYQCVCVCVRMWHLIQFTCHVSMFFFVFHQSLRLSFLWAQQRATVSRHRHGQRPQRFRWVGSSLEVAKCGRIIIIILIIFIIISIIIYIHFIFHNAVDGRNEEILYPVDMPTIPQIRGFYVSQLVQDLFHEVYFDGLFFWYVGDNLLLSSMTRLYALVTSCDKWLV